MRSSFALLLVSVLATAAAACSAADSDETDHDASQDVSLDSQEDAIIIGCSKNDQCSVGAYCKLTACTPPGICAPRPGGCTLQYAPVCGCDNKTYANSCAAAQAGVSVKHTGKCIGVL